MTVLEFLYVAMPFIVMILGYIAFRLVRREQKAWHAANRQERHPAE